MKFDYFLLVRSPFGGESEVPNDKNPTEATNLLDAVKMAVGAIETANLPVELLGIRIWPNKVKEPPRKKWVYIAGPISKGNTLHNLAAGCHVWRGLLEDGYVPICPHWTGLQDLVAPVGYEDYLSFDFELIRKCDVLLRIGGESRGADREVEFAGQIGVPVVYSRIELNERFGNR